MLLFSYVVAVVVAIVFCPVVLAVVFVSLGFFMYSDIGVGCLGFFELLGSVVCLRFL